MPVCVGLCLCLCLCLCLYARLTVQEVLRIGWRCPESQLAVKVVPANRERMCARSHTSWSTAATAAGRGDGGDMMQTRASVSVDRKWNAISRPDGGQCDWGNIAVRGQEEKETREMGGTRTFRAGTPCWWGRAHPAPCTRGHQPSGWSRQRLCRWGGNFVRKWGARERESESEGKGLVPCFAGAVAAHDNGIPSWSLVCIVIASSCPLSSSLSFSSS